uniref:Uncharacterized protein n=1 Tax=Octopus bimaculoides TaxID=37653 RepID=A0A0L8I7V5_OCTBM
MAISRCFTCFYNISTCTHIVEFIFNTLGIKTMALKEILTSSQNSSTGVDHLLIYSTLSKMYCVLYCTVVFSDNLHTP